MYKTAFLPYQSLFYEYKESREKHDMHVLQYHDCYEIYLMTKGEPYLFFEGVCHILKPGDLFILKPFEMHYTQSMDAEFYGRYMVNFSEGFLEKLLTPLECSRITDKLQSCIIHFSEEQYRRAVFLFEGIGEYSANISSLNGKLQCGYLMELLAFIGKCVGETRGLSGIEAVPDTKPEILEAIRYINSHYMEELSLDYMTEYVHLSKYYFCRQFSKTTGATFLEYLNNVRLSKVHQMLLDSDFSIGEIARRTGFSSAVQLSRAFSNIYNMSPSVFRKKSSITIY